MRRILVLTILVVIACKKEQSTGLPAAKEWSANTPPAGSAPPALPPGHPPPGHPSPEAPPAPAATAARTLEKLPDGRLALGPFSLELPKDWTEKPITSQMRAAHFILSEKPGEEADLVVYYFGDTGAGTVDANLDRWLGQLQQPDGKPSKDVAKIEKTKLGGQAATIVSVTGRYVAQAMPGATEAVDKPDQMLLAAIVESPKGPYYFKLVGAKQTVDAHAARFRGLLGSLKVR
jgi:hypothetical protein